MYARKSGIAVWQHSKTVLLCCAVLFFCAVLLCLLPDACSAQGEPGDDTTISVEIVAGEEPTPPPPPPRRDDTTTPTRIVPGPGGGEETGGPKIVVDCWGMAKSPTTGRVDGSVNMPADCWLHFGKNPDTIDEIIMGPYTTDQVLRVRYELDGLTPNTKYYFKVEGHSLQHEGLVGWSPLRDFTTPGLGEGMISDGTPAGKVGGGIPWWVWPAGALGLALLFWFLLWKRLTDYVLAPVEGSVIFHEDDQPPDSPPVVRPRMRVGPKDPLFWMKDHEGNALMVYSEEYIRILKVLPENDYEVVEEHTKILKVRRKWREALFTSKDDTKGHFYGWVWLEKQDQLEFE